MHVCVWVCACEYVRVYRCHPPPCYGQLKPSMSPDERPHDPYIEPWHSSPHMWDPETEFVTGSYARGGHCQVDRRSHHGLTAFQKLHRDDAKRKFKRGLTKLKALAKLKNMQTMFQLDKPHLKRTAEEKKGARRGLAASACVCRCCRRTCITGVLVSLAVPLFCQRTLRRRLLRCWPRDLPPMVSRSVDPPSLLTAKVRVEPAAALRQAHIRSLMVLVLACDEAGQLVLVCCCRRRRFCVNCVFVLRSRRAVGGNTADSAKKATKVLSMFGGGGGGGGSGGGALASIARALPLSPSKPGGGLAAAAAAGAGAGATPATGPSPARPSSSPSKQTGPGALTSPILPSLSSTSKSAGGARLYVLRRS